jgi:hypothetical protein
MDVTATVEDQLAILCLCHVALPTGAPVMAW